MNNTIGLDLGTGAIKGVCWNPERGILATISERVPFLHPQPDWAEIDPLAYRTQVFDIIRRLAAEGGAPVDAMAFAAASGNTLLCDNDATPLTPIISWLDHRLTDWLPPTDWNVRATVGWPAIKTFPLMHCEWLRRNSPDLLRSSRVAMNNDWLCWCLCGRHALDVSNAVPFYFWNQAENHWQQQYLDYYGLTPAQFPDMLASGDTIGTLKPELADGFLTPATRIVAGSFDHPTGARAVNVTTPNDLLLSCGTSWVGFHPEPTRDQVPANELCDPFQSRSGGCWGAMYSLPGVGVEIESFICERYGNAPERYRQFNADALAGDTPARAKMLDIIGRFHENFKKHCRSHINRIVLSGGPSEGEAWPKLLQEQLQLPVEISPYKSYTGAVGAAMLAGGFVK